MFHTHEGVYIEFSFHSFYVLRRGIYFTKESINPLIFRIFLWISTEKGIYFLDKCFSLTMACESLCQFRTTWEMNPLWSWRKYTKRVHKPTYVIALTTITIHQGQFYIVIFHSRHTLLSYFSFKHVSNLIACFFWQETLWNFF